MSKIIIDSNKFWVPDTCLDCPFLSSFNEVYVDKDNYNKIAYCTLNPSIEDPWRKISWFANNKEEWCPIKEVKMNKKETDFNEYLQKQLEDPEFREEFFKEPTEEMSQTALLTSFLETDYFEDDRLHGYRCANCGFSFTTHFINFHNYCYNCGAINIDGEAFKKRREKNGNS